MGQGGFNPTDILAVEIVENGKFDVDYQAYKTVQMFINGEYWGIYSIREKKGEEHFASNYPDIDKVDIIAHTVGGDIAKSGDLEAFNLLNNYIDEHNLSTTSNYQELMTMIDEDNFIDYMIIMIYSANEDWIYNNTRFSTHLNTTFTVENMLQLINKISDERSQYMYLEMDKWGISQSTFDDFI